MLPMQLLLQTQELVTRARASHTGTQHQLQTAFKAKPQPYQRTTNVPCGYAGAVHTHAVPARQLLEVLAIAPYGTLLHCKRSSLACNGFQLGSGLIEESRTSKVLAIVQ